MSFNSEGSIADNLSEHAHEKKETRNKHSKVSKQVINKNSPNLFDEKPSNKHQKSKTQERISDSNQTKLNPSLNESKPKRDKLDKRPAEVVVIAKNVSESSRRGFKSGTPSPPPRPAPPKRPPPPRPSSPIHSGKSKGPTPSSHSTETKKPTSKNVTNSDKRLNSKDPRTKQSSSNNLLPPRPPLPPSKSRRHVDSDEIRREDIFSNDSIIYEIDELRQRSSCSNSSSPSTSRLNIHNKAVNTRKHNKK
jgi:hypothetical protein